MNPEEYELMYRVELQHWWYRGMENITQALLSLYYQPGSHLKILDAGCGTGAAASTYLPRFGQVTAMDISNIGLNFCQKRQINDLALASVQQLPFLSNHFNLVTSFDVLYEKAVADDLMPVQEFNRVLVKGGRLLLRLPAYNWLQGRHDRAVYTARRYTTSRVKHLLQTAGFKIEKITYANTLLFPLALVKRLAEHLLPDDDKQSDLAQDMGALNPILQKILAFEASFLTHSSLPYGLSVIAIGQKI